MALNLFAELAQEVFRDSVTVSKLDPSIRGKVDKLEGLKENVLLGKLIPAGTGLKHYRDVSYNLESELMDDEPLDKLEDEIME